MDFYYNGVVFRGQSIVSVDIFLILVLLFMCIAENLITDLILGAITGGYIFLTTLFGLLFYELIRDAYWPLYHRFGVLSTKLCYHFFTTN